MTAAGSLLIRVQDDPQYDRMKRVGRFAIEQACAASMAHMEAAIIAAKNEMIEGIAKLGYVYQDAPWALDGPFEHLDWSDDLTPDLGGRDAPHPLDLAEQARFARAERQRVARTLGMRHELCDYTLTTVFVRRRAPAFHTVAPLMRPGGVFQ